MPKFAFRLEAQDGSGHYRVGSGVFDSEQEAREHLEQKERQIVDYRLTIEQVDELVALALPEGDDKARVKLAKELVDKGLDADGFRGLPPRVRAAVATHQQAGPYKLVKLEEVA